MSAAGKAKRCFWLLILMLVAGCGGKAPLIPYTDEELAQEIFPPGLPALKPSPTPVPQYLTHIVQGPGETYMAIARWYTGNGDNWKRIAQANPDIEPRYMHIGTAIRIPAELLITHQPMRKAAPAITVKPKAPAPAPAPPADVELYGPIETSTDKVKPGSNEATPELEPLE